MLRSGNIGPPMHTQCTDLSVRLVNFHAFDHKFAIISAFSLNFDFVFHLELARN